jgi:hypothetical protein
MPSFKAITTSPKCFDCGKGKNKKKNNHSHSFGDSNSSDDSVDSIGSAGSGACMASTVALPAQVSPPQQRTKTCPDCQKTFKSSVGSNFSRCFDCNEIKKNGLTQGTCLSCKQKCDVKYPRCFNCSFTNKCSVCDQPCKANFRTCFQCRPAVKK